MQLLSLLSVYIKHVCKVTYQCGATVESGLVQYSKRVYKVTDQGDAMLRAEMKFVNLHIGFKKLENLPSLFVKSPCLYDTIYSVGYDTIYSGI